MIDELLKSVNDAVHAVLKSDFAARSIFRLYGLGGRGCLLGANVVRVRENGLLQIMSRPEKIDCSLWTRGFRVLLEFQWVEEALIGEIAEFLVVSKRGPDEMKEGMQSVGKPRSAIQGVVEKDVGARERVERVKVRRLPPNQRRLVFSAKGELCPCREESGTARDYELLKCTARAHEVRARPPNFVVR